MSRSIQYTTSPLLASRTPVWRSKFVVGFIALGFVGLAARAVHIQVAENGFYIKQGQVRFARTLDIPSSRGRILDRNGIVMASSVVAPSIEAFPEDVVRDKEQLRKLARLLEMTEGELNKKLEEDKKYVWLKLQVDEPVAKQIADLKLKGIYLRKGYKRQYTQGEAAAHVVGFTNVEGKGQEGVELAFNKSLAGLTGARRVIKDGQGNVVEVVGEELPAVDGQDLVLSIDSKVQFFAYQKLREAVISNKAKAGSVVVLDTTTGELLALANYPSYEPDKRKSLSGAQLRNIALTDVFEPGSTMKPFVIGLALETGRVKPETVIQTAPGTLTISGVTIHDAHPHGPLTVEQVIQVSSNVGTTKIAMQMQPREMWEIFSAAGFGQKPQISFPGAVTGRLRAYKTWKPVEQATMSYGYGLSASLFQMARSYTVFAHDGQIIPATLVKSSEPAVGVRVISPNTAAQIRKMLQMAAGPGGTGPKAQTVGYSVGGKSGTAHKQIGRSYATNKYRAWFTGMAPIDKPRIVVAVMIDEPSAGKYFGGEVAAPVFSDVVQQSLRLMGVPPDMALKPQVVAARVEESF